MNSMPLITHLIAFTTGAALGAVFLWALWQSVRRIARSAHPAASVFGGMTVRIALVTSVLYGVLSLGGWTHLISALVGFTLTRFVLTRHFNRAWPYSRQANGSESSP
jgi:F1F0 ATPase subunit 2